MTNRTQIERILPRAATWVVEQYNQTDFGKNHPVTNWQDWQDIPRFNFQLDYQTGDVDAGLAASIALSELNKRGYATSLEQTPTLKQHAAKTPELATAINEVALLREFIDKTRKPNYTATLALTDACENLVQMLGVQKEKSATAPGH